VDTPPFPLNTTFKYNSPDTYISEEAKDKLSTLPMVQEGLIYFDFISLVPYPGFERLFKVT